MTRDRRLAAFRQAAERSGLALPEHIVPVRIVRFPGIGKSNGNTSGWAWISEDGQGGAYGDWASGLSDTWHAQHDQTMTAAERAAHTRRVAELRRIHEEEERLRHAEAAQRAQSLWDGAKPVPANYPYLMRKGIYPHGLRLDDESRLLIPVMLDGTISSLQFIDANGGKQFLPGGKVKGGAFTLGEVTQGCTILLCEGFATAASLYEATGRPVVVAFNAGNLLPVARALRATYPHLTLIVCADDDAATKGNPGITKATEVARAVAGWLVVPDFGMDRPKGLTDFNDLANLRGPDVVKQAIDTAIKEGLTMQNDQDTAQAGIDIGSHSTPAADTAHLHTPPALAQNPHILAAFEQAVRLCGVVGEERCAKLLYLALTSRVLAEPVSLAIKGLSSSGKSFTTETALKFFPTTAYIAMTAMSERALIYMKEDFKHKTLVIFEAVALREQREKNDSNLTAYFVRSLLSEGRIAYPVTVRDKERGFVTTTITKEGPTNVILTTTATELHNENETRMLSIPTNDSREQTKAIMRRLAQGKAQAVDFAPWHDLQEWLATAEHRVTIPYAEYLAEHMPPVAVRLRRDFRSILRLIEAHAILHQCTRARDEGGRIIATGADYMAVRALVADLVASGVGATVPDTTRDTVQAVQKLTLVADKGVTVRQVEHKLKLDRSATQRRVKAARERGYLVNLEEKRGRPARYVIGDPLPEEVELLPQDVPDGGVQHSTPEADAPVHSVSAVDAESSAAPVQVCSGSGEVYADESEEVINLVD